MVSNTTDDLPELTGASQPVRLSNEHYLALYRLSLQMPGVKDGDVRSLIEDAADDYADRYGTAFDTATAVAGGVRE